MGDIYKKYPSYSDFKVPSAASCSTNSDSKHPKTDSSTEAGNRKNDEMKVFGNSPHKNRRYSARHEPVGGHRKQAPLGRTQESSKFKNPHQYGKNSPFHSQNGHCNVSSSKQWQESRDLETSTTKELSDVYRDSEKTFSDSSTKKATNGYKPQQLCTIDLLQNIEDTVRNSKQSLDELPNPPYSLKWSTLFKEYGFPQDIVDMVHQREFKAYINQPAHKKGHGLFYGEFQDLPPRFQRQAEEALINAFRKYNLFVPDETGFCNVPQENLNSGQKGHTPCIENGHTCDIGIDDASTSSLDSVQAPCKVHTFPALRTKDGNDIQSSSTVKETHAQQEESIKANSKSVSKNLPESHKPEKFKIPSRSAVEKTLKQQETCKSFSDQTAQNTNFGCHHNQSPSHENRSQPKSHQDQPLPNCYVNQALPDFPQNQSPSKSYQNQSRTNSHPDKSRTNSHPDKSRTNSHPDKSRTNSHPDQSRTNSHPDQSQTNSHENQSLSYSHGIQSIPDFCQNQSLPISHQNQSLPKSHRDQSRSDSDQNQSRTNSHQNQSRTNSHRNQSRTNSHRNQSLANRHQDQCQTNSHQDQCQTNSHQDQCQTNSRPGQSRSNSNQGQSRSNSNQGQSQSNSYQNQSLQFSPRKSNHNLTKPHTNFQNDSLRSRSSSVIQKKKFCESRKGGFSEESKHALCNESKQSAFREKQPPSFRKLKQSSPPHRNENMPPNSSSVNEIEQNHEHSCYDPAIKKILDKLNEYARKQKDTANACNGIAPKVTETTTLQGVPLSNEQSKSQTSKQSLNNDKSNEQSVFRKGKNESEVRTSKAGVSKTQNEKNSLNESNKPHPSEQEFCNMSKYAEGSSNSVTNTNDKTSLRVCVSNEADDDATFWHSYFSSILSHQNFEILSTSKIEVLLLVFPNRSYAKRAYCLMKDKYVPGKRKSTDEPHVTKISPPEPYKEKLICSMPKIIENCEREISKLFEQYNGRHQAKTKKIYYKFKELINGSDKSNSLVDEQETLKIQLQMMEEMNNVFCKYYNGIKDHLFTLEEISIKEITKLKNNFQHECNFLDGGLPIYSKKDEIMKGIRENQVTVLTADTGSGKSTQLVQYLLREGFGENGKIVCTQPRKIAAVSLARYISGLLGSPLGHEVGYETGLTVKIRKNTKIVYMTDCTLLKKFAWKKVDDISCVIVDEAHERSLYTDLLLGLLKRHLRTQEKDFKIIITSATIDPSVFLEYFQEGAHLLKVPGRIYPVDVRWQLEDAFIGWNYVKATVDKAYDVHCQSDGGDILAFLATPAEIEDAIRQFHSLDRNPKRNTFKAQLMSLHGKLDAETQMQIFGPTKTGHRKIIFATNSAETSITVPGIKYVIDSGMVKERKYDAEKKRSFLAIGFINRSSAGQRKGRAGRTQPGICYRMYSKNNFEKDMTENTVPEILRVNLQQAVLEILNLHIQPSKFDFVDKPANMSIENAVDSLESLGAVTRNMTVTQLGKNMLKIPLEPQLAKLILRGIEKGIGYESVIVAAMTTLSGRIFYRPELEKEAADRRKKPLCIEQGDFHTYLWVYMQWAKVEIQCKDQWCHDRYIHPKTMKMAEQIIDELRLILANYLGISVSKSHANMTTFNREFEAVVFDCFSENLFVFSGHGKSGYLSPYLDGSFFIHPSSAICYLEQKMPMFILCSGILKTSRPFLINVCQIEESTIINAHQKGKFNFQIDLLKQLQILPRVLRPIGALVLKKYILGRSGEKMREIEDKIYYHINTHACHLDVNVVKGEIVTYVEQHHQKTVNDVVNAAIEDAHKDLAKEEMIIEEMVNDRSLPISYSLTCGGEIKDIVLPGEFKELSIQCRTSFFNVASLISQLEQFELSCYSETSSLKRKTVIAVFPKVLQAQRAMDFLKQNEDYIVSGKSHIAHVTGRSVPLIVITASWTRLPCKGTGWIELNNPNDHLTACFQLTHNRLCIDNQYILIEPTPKKNASIYMYHVSPLAEERDVKSAANRLLQDFNINIRNVTLVREDGFETTGQDLIYIKKQLFKHFAPYTSPQNLVINLTTPRKNDAKWEALLSFTNLEEGVKAITELKGKLKIDSWKVDLEATLKCSLYCRKPVFNVLETDIEKIGRKCKKSKKCIKFSIEPKNNALMCISVVCQTVEELYKVRNELVELNAGYHIDCSENEELLALLSGNSQTSLKEIESNYKSHIDTNPAKKLISIYGSKAACTRTEAEIRSLCKSFKRTQTKSFNLNSDSMPKGFLKVLYNRYGFGLVNFIKQFHLKHAYINVLHHELVLQGLPKRIEEAEAHVEGICAELDENNENVKRARQNNGRITEICPICFDETSMGDSLRLEHCGHAVCKPCLQLQLESDVFPIVCVKEECEQPYFIEDLRNIMAGNQALKQHLAEAVLKNFVSRNPQDVQYCPTPNCPMVYRVNTVDPEFVCPCCENSLCTVCHSLYHHGMTCEMYQNSQEDVDYSLKVWIQGDPSNRKMCPKCSSAIEKNGGCDHITCANCNSHFCWLCLKNFDTAAAVYDHLPYCENAEK